MQIVDNLIFIAVLLAVAIPMSIGFLAGAPFVPTPMEAVREMLKLAKLKPGMVVCDPGCGDGRLIVEAATKYGAKARGYELFLMAYLMAKWRNFRHGSKAKIYFRDSRKVSLADVDVLVCYLLPGSLAILKKKWERELKPGAKVVSYAFEIAGWTPTYIHPRDPKKGLSRILVYEVAK